MSSQMVERASRAADAYRNMSTQATKEALEESKNMPTVSYSLEYVYRMTMFAILGVLFVVFLTTSNEKIKKYVLLAMKIWVPITILGYVIILVIYLINR